MLPARNRRDLRDVPQATQAALQFVWLDTVQDAIHAAFGTGTALQERPHFDLV
jgi:ATP-dependent Lon protease